MVFLSSEGTVYGKDAVCPLIQHTFGFSELNKVASGMEIQYLHLPFSGGCFRYFLLRFWKNFSVLRHTSPLPPDVYVLYPVVPESGAASLVRPSGTDFIRHGSTATWTYSYIFSVQFPDCLCLIIFPKPSQKLAAAN